MNITIAGGCFPVQHNIPKGRLYHDTFRRMLLERELDTNLTIVRYERFSTCLGKIEASNRTTPADLLIFHLRTEPAMRLCKLYYKYVDSSRILRHSLNLPVFNIINPERYEIPTSRIVLPQAGSKVSESGAHHFLREANYFLGAAVGNWKFAVDSYMKLLDDVVGYCRKKSVRLLVVGPVSRPLSRLENRLSMDIHEAFNARAKKSGTPYLNILGMRDGSGNYLFLENGIHVNQAGHDWIGRLIFEKLVYELLPGIGGKIAPGKNGMSR